MIIPRGSTAPTATVLLVVAVALAGLPFAVMGGFAGLVYPPYAGIGALLAIRKPGNPIGWLLIGLSWTFLNAYAPLRETTAAIQAGTASPFEMLMAWSSVWVPTTGFALLLAIMIIFPTGHLPTGRWRGPAVMAIVAAAFCVLLAALVPTVRITAEGQPGQVVAFANPMTFLPDAPPWDWLTETFPYPVFVAVLMAAAGSMLVRATRATGQERQQLRWVVTAFAALTCTLPLGFAILIVFGDAVGVLAWLPTQISITLPPIAIGIAILRYRLYDIDRIVSRTIAYALVSAILAVVFGGVVVLLSTALSSLVQGQTIAVAASTLVAFALFQPLRRRVQSAVDRRFDRSRYDAERTVAKFSDRLRDRIDLAHLSSDLDATIRDAIAPRSFGIWIRESRR
jgi:membrane protein implicated in regulation of membrane protease activity